MVSTTQTETPLERYSCTGVAASYCPLHGDCTCRASHRVNPGAYTSGCPLHDPSSPHTTATWVFDVQRDVPLNLNHGMHWTAKRQIVKELREESMVQARVARIPRMRKIRMRLIFVPPDNRRRDADNLVAAMKPLADGLVDARLVRDDTPAEIDKQMPVIAEPMDGRGHLIVVVERLL